MLGLFFTHKRKSPPAACVVPGPFRNYHTDAVLVTIAVIWLIDSPVGVCYVNTTGPKESPLCGDVISTDPNTINYFKLRIYYDRQRFTL